MSAIPVEVVEIKKVTAWQGREFVQATITRFGFNTRSYFVSRASWGRMVDALHGRTTSTWRLPNGGYHANVHISDEAYRKYIQGLCEVAE